MGRDGGQQTSSHGRRRATIALVRAAARRCATACVLCLAACQGATSETAAEQEPREDRAAAAPRARAGAAAQLGSADKSEFMRAWEAFLGDEPAWPRLRSQWVARGPAQREVLAENLFRYFWAVSMRNRADEVERIGHEARHVAEEAVPWFSKPLLLDRVALAEPMRVRIEDLDDARQVRYETVDHLNMDDTTRKHAALVLAAVGEPAVPFLSRSDVLLAGRPGTRRAAARALGAIGSDAAVAALENMISRAAEWQDRAAAVEGLAVAVSANPRARPALERAAADPDPFVRRKAEEGLLRAR